MLLGCTELLTGSEVGRLLLPPMTQVPGHCSTQEWRFMKVYNIKRTKKIKVEKNYIERIFILKYVDNELEREWRKITMA